jgi:hypothetical protein
VRGELAVRIIVNFIGEDNAGVTFDDPDKPGERVNVSMVHHGNKDYDTVTISRWRNHRNPADLGIGWPSDGWERVGQEKQVRVKK